MGAEGNNNLDNDAAGDLLYGISCELSARILELLVHPRGHEYDDEEIAELFVRIEMAFALHGRGMLLQAPDPEELLRLLDPFTKRWEAYHRAAGHEPPSKRKKTMAAAFQQLLTVSMEIDREQGNLGPVDLSSVENADDDLMKGIFDTVEGHGNVPRDP